MPTWTLRAALAAGAFSIGFAAVRWIVPPTSPAAHEHRHAEGEPPALSDEEFEALIARERPWLLPLRSERLAWQVDVSQPRAETERVWDAASPLDSPSSSQRDLVLAELSRKLENARMRLEQETGDERRRAELPDKLLWALEANYADARLQLDHFAAGRARTLAMDTLPLQLSELEHEGAYLSEHLSEALERLLVFRIEPAEEAHLHGLKSALRRTLTAR